MKRIIILIAITFGQWTISKGQDSITLEECYRWVSENAPLIKQKKLYQDAFDNQKDILDHIEMPDVSWNTKVQIQSDAISLKLPFPGGEGIELPYYNIQSMIDVGYLLMDGGMLDSKRNIAIANLSANLQSVEVDIYQLRERINKYYWSILLLEAHQRIMENAMKRLEIKMSKLETMVGYGVILPGVVEKLKAERLKTKSKIMDIKGKQRSLRSLLAAYTGRSEVLDAKLIKPVFTGDIMLITNHRPEQKLFDIQSKKVLANQELIDVEYKPKLRAFLKVGLGYPSPINLFKTEVSPYAIGGIQLSWKLLDWGQRERQKQKLEIQSQIILSQKEMFDYNISNLKEKYQSDLASLREQIKLDDELIFLQRGLLDEQSAQLEQGVITSTEYLSQFNEKIQAELNKELHLIQIEQLKQEYITRLGG